MYILSFIVKTTESIMFPFCSPTSSSGAVYVPCLDSLREMTYLVTSLGGVVVLVEITTTQGHHQISVRRSSRVQLTVVRLVESPAQNTLKTKETMGQARHSNTENLHPLCCHTNI